MIRSLKDVAGLLLTRSLDFRPSVDLTRHALM